ncbi:hypothetical protein [Corynebacterium callunae]|uniref:hypothetical protein n=1 Tax=Corynebacterium callunae TaxID=1721 RepID=UPI001FFF6905|nr:hypothetical protein [Corynebacterium callunae]MCK2200467.1 hypothetical protein [Corynebacterium callunae]
MIDWQQLPQGTPVWLTIAIAVTTIFLSFTERAAKLRGPMGAMARWWNDRQIHAVKRQKDLDAHIDDLVEQRTTTRFQELTSDIELLKAQIDQLRTDLERERTAWRTEREQLIVQHEKELAEIRHSEQQKHEYIVMITSTLRRIEIWAADLGIALPPPPFQSYTEWLENRIRDPT